MGQRQRCPPSLATTSASTARRTVSTSSGFPPVAGRVSGSNLVRLAELAEANGSHRIRTTPLQKLLVLDLDESKIDSLIAGAEECGLSARRDAWRRSVMACTGIEFCKLAIVETKAQAARVVDELERRLGALESPITVHLNGCPNSCARIQVADIGLKGQLVVGANGDQVKGYQVHLGGGLVWTRGIRSQAQRPPGDGRRVPDYVERLARHFVAERRDGERFTQWVGECCRSRCLHEDGPPDGDLARDPAGGAVLPVLRRRDPLPAEGGGWSAAAACGRSPVTFPRLSSRGHSGGAPETSRQESA